MYRVRTLIIVILLPFFVACTDSSAPSSKPTPAQSQWVQQQIEPNTEQQLTVYKSPSCNCCNKWIHHVEAKGFSVAAQHPGDLGAIKDRYQIAPSQRSCHTAVSSQGYVFEGHVPARFMHQFLASPPADAFGLTVPAMPVGSPGMEVNERFMPYQVLLLKKDGSTEVFANVESLAQQHKLNQQPGEQP